MTSHCIALDYNDLSKLSQNKNIENIITEYSFCGRHAR